MKPAVLSRGPLRQRDVADISKLADQSIVARITFFAQTNPMGLAVADELCNLTWSQLDQQSNQLAAYLKQAGAAPEKCVGLFIERSTQFVVAALAVIKSGAAYLPLDPSTPAERVAFILQDADAQILLTHAATNSRAANTKCRVINLDSAAGAISAMPVAPLGIENDSRSLAYVVYTSGSTGKPKGVEIMHYNLCNLIDWHQRAFDVTEKDRVSQVAGLGFDATAWEIWPALTAGASLHIAGEMTRRSPQTLREWLIQQKITVSFVPTVLAEQLLHSAWPKETALRILLTGADTLRRRPIEGLPFTFVNNYGPSECTVVATSGVVSPDNTGSQPSIGKAIYNTGTLILDEQLRPLPIGEPGELCLAGAHVGRGYRNNPTLTAQKFVNYTNANGQTLRIYRTGDRAKMLENGEIAFLGRLDDQVKIRGYRIEVGEIVATLDRYPGIEASAVVVREESTGPALIAYVIPQDGTNLTAADVREFLAARLPDYMVPARFVAMKAFPVTNHGKLDRAALPAPTAENLLPASGSVTTAPTAAGNDVESRIGEMVATLLGQPSVGHGDNFFMLGGHSMLGVQLVARIRDTFGVKLTLRQLFSAPTVAGLSAEVARLTVNSGR